MITQGSKRHPVREIIIHCTATRPDWWAGKRTSQKVAEIRRWHVQDRGWNDIGYHYLIDRDGTLESGRPINVVGAHVAGHNSGTIGISLFGGHGSSADDAFADHFTEAQEKALRGLIATIKRQTPIDKITGHNDYAAKACPGFKVSRWLAAQQSATAPKPGPVRPKQQPAPAPAKKPGAGGVLAAIIALIGRMFGRKQ